jgi:hypothetical protein
VGSLELGEGEASPEGEVVDEVVVRVVLGPRVRVHLRLGVHIRGRGRVVEQVVKQWYSRCRHVDDDNERRCGDVVVSGERGKGAELQTEVRCNEFFLSLSRSLRL